MRIPKISVSRKQIWDECKQKYKYKYHLKIESPEEEPYYFVFGKIVHKAAEEYVRHEGKIPLKQITKDILEGKIILEEYEGEVSYAPDKMPTNYKKRLNGMLNSIQKFTDRVGFGGELEWDFEHDLEPPNEKFVRGFIDRLIIRDGSYFIIDYKTTKPGRYQKSQSEIMNDLQLRTYARVVQQHYNISASQIKCALLYLDGGSLVSAQYSENSLALAEEELLYAFNSIVETDPDQVWGSVGHWCNRCEYKTICPFYRNRNQTVQLPESLR